MQRIPTTPEPAGARPFTQPITRREITIAGLILAAGIGLRLVALSTSSVEHFDEGVYASNLYCGEPDNAYPDQRLYAPPLLAVLIEAGMIAGLPPNLAALLPSWLAGIGTIAALWWFGRTWFSPPVGLAAATLAALSDFHIAYSAAALTDVLLGLWLILAVDAIGRSLTTNRVRWSLAAGVFTGLAWWTKYNGWLPLAILAAALPLLWMLLRVPRSQAVRWIGQFAVTTFIAAAVWSPYYLSLQSHGGYGPIATNHEKYIVGLSGWLISASRHLASQHVMEGYASSLAPAVALVIAATCFGTSETSPLRLRRSTYIKLSAWALFVAALAWLGTSFLLLGAAALVGLALHCAMLMKAESRDQRWTRSVIGLSLVAVWWCGLLVATPCYQPYPRLVLPWLISTWLAAAVCGDEVLRPLLGEKQAISRGQYVLLVVGVVTVIATTIMFRATTAHLEVPPVLSTDRQQLVAIAKQAHARLETSGVDASLPPSAPSRAVYVHGEPALFFQLAAAGEPIVVPTQDVPPAATFFDQPIPTYLVVGPHTRRDPAFLRQWKSAHPNWNLIQSWTYEPSALVWLDLNDPRFPKKANHAEHDRIDLYRLK